jgi:hypothetical protein
MMEARKSAILSLVLVFLSGILVGGLGYRFYSLMPLGGAQAQRAQNQKGKYPSPEEVRKRLSDEMRSRLKLDDAQVAAISKIFEDTRHRYDDMRDRMNEEGRQIRDDQREHINKVLRPDQQKLYTIWREEMDAHRRTRGGPGSGPNGGPQMGNPNPGGPRPGPPGMNRPDGPDGFGRHPAGGSPPQNGSKN